MKILIVTTYFPPLNSIASLRPYSWAKYWSQMGHDITVLTQPYSKTDNSLNLSFDGFKCIQIESPIKKLYQKITKQNADLLIENTSFLSQKKKKMNTISFSSKILSFFTKRGCLIDCRFPDTHDFWAKSALKKVNPSDFDLVVSTGWPYSVHRVGLQFKNSNWKGKWILDWRDLWTTNHMYSGLKIFHPYEKMLEKQFHSHADLITTVSDGLADTLRIMTDTPVSVVYNGFDVDDFKKTLSKPRKNNKKFTIVYTGTIYKNYRDPSALFQTIKDLDAQKEITPDTLEIVFAGRTGNIDEIIGTYGIDQYIQILGLLPREQAIQMQYDADVVLFLEYENPKVKGVLTGKLFEYLYLSREIWAVGCSNKTAAGQLIEKTATGECFGYDTAKLKQRLLDRINNREFDNKNKDFSIIEKFSRKKQAEEMLNLLR